MAGFSPNWNLEDKKRLLFGEKLRRTAATTFGSRDQRLGGEGWERFGDENQELCSCVLGVDCNFLFFWEGKFQFYSTKQNGARGG